MRFAIQTPAHRAFDESETTLRIARAAKRVFIKTGGSNFSMRLVAKEAGISVGALQHCYPKRDKLLAAMLEFVTNEYEQAYDKVFRSLPYNGESRLLGVIDCLCADIMRQETRSFFFALWAMSCHNKLASGIMSDMYAHHVGNLAAFIGAARPQLTEERCKALAKQMAALTDGMMIFTAPGGQHFDSRESLTATLRRALLDLIDGSRADSATTLARRQTSAA